MLSPDTERGIMEMIQDAMLRTPDGVVNELAVEPAVGLGNKEVEQRRSKYGPNELHEEKGPSLVERFLAQFRSALIVILLAAAVVSGVLGEPADAVIIAAIVLINAILGVIQESRAEQALEALRNMSSPQAVVRREGTTREIASGEIVPGDVVLLDAGRIVPCDLRLIDTANLKVEESALTGESVPVDKDAMAVIENADAPLGDQQNMAFSGTVVTYGRGVGVAVATGMRTQIGRIAEMLGEQDERTPLQEQLATFGRRLGFVILGLCGLMFLIGLLQSYLQDGSIPDGTILELFLTAVSLAVAAIPEGLPAIVTVVLAIGVQQMSRQNAIVRRLPAVETLGSVTIVCSDKTGTLTLNQMTVTRLLTRDGGINSLADVASSNRLLLTALVHCNDAESDGEESTGDPTEVALVDAGLQNGLIKEELLRTQPRVNEKPFDSDRKMMSTVAQSGNRYTVYTKGALDSVLPRCTRIRTQEGEREITDEDREYLSEQSRQMSAQALRVLAAAYRTIDSPEEPEEGFETDLTFLGAVGMIDPPRSEVVESIRACRSAGVTPVMITGDHVTTALAIARELTLATDESETLSGAQIDGLTDEQLSESCRTVRVFGRVSPEHKVRIVNAFQAQGYLVSMTGDGVNDAPSLKAADIGVAMGITGTDVAKGASDMILTDDNFSTIVSAIAAGRNIYDNIKRSVTFLLSCNAGEIVAIFTAILVGWETPLLPVHILWVNLITDSLPAIGLGMTRPDPDVLSRPPRDKTEGVLNKGTRTAVLWNGLVIGIITLVAFRLGYRIYPDSLLHARTLAFVVLALSQLFHAFDLIDVRQSLFGKIAFSNRWLWLALGVGVLIQIIVVTVPPLASLFEVFPLTLSDWGFATAIAFVPVVLNEIVKGVRRIRVR
jgi:Ca2+-transporting ATPase